jgi:hypothetical protein
VRQGGVVLGVVTIIEQEAAAVLKPVLPEESVTWAVKLSVPGVVGVPEITPDDKLRSSGEIEPLVIWKVYDGTPPVAERAAVYGVPTVPAARPVQLSARGGCGATWKEKSLERVAEFAGRVIVSAFVIEKGLAVGPLPEATPPAFPTVATAVPVPKGLFVLSTYEV